jgi:hypothetical protein
MSESPPHICHNSVTGRMYSLKKRCDIVNSTISAAAGLEEGSASGSSTH